jgi:aminoglycoside phosphotransferase (APT) family kinase protein
VERKTLGRYSVLAHTLLERLREEGQIPSDAATRVVRAIRTRSDVIVMMLGDARSGETTCVLKLPLTAGAEQSTAEHRKVVMAMHQTPGLEQFCAFVPKPMAWGEHDRQAYYLESALAGVAAADLIRKHREPASLVRQAFETIWPLQEATAQRQLVDEAVFTRLAGEDLARLRRLAASWPEPALLARKLDALEILLRCTMLGSTLPFSWSHGDYWPGNILVRERDGVMSGIVDWDRASTHQLPLLDILHLLAYTRKMRRRTELGEQIVGYLLPAAFDEQERALVDATIERLALPKGEDFLGAAALLYWLRFAAANLSRYPAFARDRDWLRDNVILVLKRGLL